MQRLCDGLGIDLASVGLLSSMQNSLSAIASAVSALESATGPDTLADVESALVPATQAFEAVRGLVDGLHASAMQLPSGFSDVLGDLPQRLVDYLIGRRLLDGYPITGAFLQALQALTSPLTPGTAIHTTTNQPAYVPVAMAQVDYAYLFNLLSDPLGQLKEQYLAGATGADAVTALTKSLWPQVAALLNAFGLPIALGSDPRITQVVGDLGAAGDAVADTTVIIPLASDGADALAGVARPDPSMLTLSLLAPQAASPAALVGSVQGGLDVSLDVGDWSVTLSASGTAQAFAVDSSGGVTLLPNAPATDDIAATLSVTNNGTPDTPVLLLGSATGTRLEVSAVSFTASTAIGSGAPASLSLELDLTGAQLVIDLSDGDGLLSFVNGLVGGPVQVSFDLGFGWSRSGGVFLRAGASANANGAQNLTATLPTSFDLGPVHIPSVNLGLSLPGGGLGTWAGPDLQFSLGPVGLTVFGFGLEFDVGPATGGTGNLGPLSLSVRLRPPTGASIGISAPAVSGAGLLNSPSPDNYMGAVALQVGDLSISGVGLLSTRTPTGQQEFSLVVLASVGIPMVEIGFGFSLVGLGALVGVNRTINVPALQALGRSGGLSSVLFPVDLVHTAPQVASTLSSLFPSADGQFVVGPAAHVTWGTGGIVDIELGIWIELPSPLRVALVGVLSMTLPEADAPIADLTLDLVGVLDLSAKTMAIDASLRGSSLAGFPLTGSAALRAGWGANPEFVIAIGGFYPSFVPPSGFPVLQRISLVIGDGDPQLTCAAYLALTSNTIQFGTAASLYASAGPAVISASLSFDALIQLKPFALTVDLQISVSVSLEGWSALSITLALHLTGPSPWHITGKASISVLFFSISIPINITVGPSSTPALPQTVDLDGNLLHALEDPHAWSFGPPPGGALVVVRDGQTSDATGAAAHPLGTITFQQSAVPFGQHLDRYGPDVLDAPCQYSFGATTVGGAAVTPTSVQAPFAPAQFETLTDSEKLTAPGFTPMVAGAVLAPSGLGLPTEADGQLSCAVESQAFDCVVYGVASMPASSAAQASAGAGPASSRSLVVPADLLSTQLAGAAAAKANTPTYTGGSPSGIALTAPTYVIASDLAPVSRSGPQVATSLAFTAALAGALTLAGPGSAGTPTAATEPQVIYASEVPGQAVVLQ